jgi:hypothetical protein
VKTEKIGEKPVPVPLEEHKKYWYVFLDKRSAGMRFRNKKKLLYGVPTYTELFLALSTSINKWHSKI